KREIAGRGWVVATYGSFVLNVTPDRYFYAPGSRATFAVEARDYDRQPIAARVHVELLRWNWRNKSSYELKGATDAQTGADGNATAELTLPPQGGSYYVKVSTRTPEGRDIEQRTYLWLSGGGGDDFGARSNRNVTIIPDKKTYRAGETAKLL